MDCDYLKEAEAICAEMGSVKAVPELLAIIKDADKKLKRYERAESQREDDAGWSHRLDVLSASFFAHEDSFGYSCIKDTRFGWKWEVHGPEVEDYASGTEQSERAAFFKVAKVAKAFGMDIPIPGWELSAG